MCYLGIYHMLENQLKNIFSLIKKNQLDEAEKLTLILLGTDKKNIHIENVLAIILACRKEYSKAIKILNNILKREPNFMDSIINLANIHRDLRNYSLSILYYNKYIQIGKKTPAILFELAKTFDLDAKHSEAEKLYREILSSNNEITVLVELYKNQIFLNKLEQAIKILSILEENNYNFFELLILKSLLEIKKSNFNSAEKFLLDAKKINPNSDKIYSNLGSIYSLKGDHKNAIINFKKNIDLIDDSNSKYNLSLSNLSLGLFEEGWKYYLYRSARINLLNSLQNKIIWKGKKFEGVLIIHAEQGVGEEIIFSSIFNDVLNLQKQITITCDERFLKLFKRSFPKISFITKNKFNNFLNSHNHQNIFAGDLGQFFRKKIEDFKNDSWIVANLKLIQKYNKLIKKNKKFKIGIGWTSFSNQNNLPYKDRTISLNNISNLFPEDKFDLINLQYGDIHTDIKKLKHDNNRDISFFDFIDYTNDLDDLAAIMLNCDLVISPGSFTSSFAASLGVKTLVMVPTNFGWCWSTQIDNKSIWFPSAKIFIQKTKDNWSDILKELKKEIDQYFI